MDLHGSKAYSRRAFLQRGVTLASSAVTVPYFLQSSAVALARPANAGTSVAGVPEERVLVVVQLAGGNDGLNTVIPFEDDSYYRLRPQIGIPGAQVHKLSARSSIGLHPAMDSMKELYDDGLLTVVQGVGYPNPNRSHFTSMDIWHTADTSGVGDGWLGRFFDAQCAGADPRTGKGAPAGHAGVAVGRDAPLAMQGRQYRPISFETADMFRWTGLDLHPSMAQPYEEILESELDPTVEQGNPSAAFLTRTAMDAQVASAKIRRAVDTDPLVRYPNSGLARQLAMVASMIRAGLETRVYYVSLGGFDTHAGQGGAGGQHANLLRTLSEAVNAFYKDLQAQGNDGRVLTMSFSEFGRRVGQNASNGTDHGAAAPMFLMGPMVRPGVHGGHPSLTDLDAGDLKYHTDFRNVYSAVLGEWLKADSSRVLGGTFKPLRVLKT
ncbi:MAG: DUF1501 domain-containing protein [Planctomycetota bacterium]